MLRVAAIMVGVLAAGRPMLPATAQVDQQWFDMNVHWAEQELRGICGLIYAAEQKLQGELHVAQDIQAEEDRRHLTRLTELQAQRSPPSEFQKEEAVNNYNDALIQEQVRRARDEYDSQWRTIRQAEAKFWAEWNWRRHNIPTNAPWPFGYQPRLDKQHCRHIGPAPAH